MEQIDRISQAVREYAEKNSYLIPSEHINQTDMNQLVDIGTSIMCTKWEIGNIGGNFVQSIVNNDLNGAINHGDHVCSRCLKFFTTLHYNLGYVN